MLQNDQRRDNGILSSRGDPSIALGFGCRHAWKGNRFTQALYHVATWCMPWPWIICVVQNCARDEMLQIHEEDTFALTYHVKYSSRPCQTHLPSADCAFNVASKISLTVSSLVASVSGSIPAHLLCHEVQMMSRDLTGRPPALHPSSGTCTAPVE